MIWDYEIEVGAQVTLPTTSVQHNPPSPQYNIAFTADLQLVNAPPVSQPVQTPTVPDQRYFVNFADNSATISPAEITNLLAWSYTVFRLYPRLRDTIRSGQVTVRLTGRASVRGNAQHNFTLSQQRVDRVRTALEGEHRRREAAGHREASLEASAWILKVSPLAISMTRCLPT